jgi:hypothetical protein
VTVGICLNLVVVLDWQFPPEKATQFCGSFGFGFVVDFERIKGTGSSELLTKGCRIL